MQDASWSAGRGCISRQYSKAGKEIYTNQLLNLMCTLYFLFLQAIKGIVTVAFVCVVHGQHHCVFCSILCSLKLGLHSAH